MNRIKNRNYKGFIFTLDAVFALVIAALGVSILLYVDFTNPSSYAATSIQAYSILQSMLQTTVGSASSGSAYFAYLSTSSNASTLPWPQFGNDSRLSSATAYSTQTPYLLYTYAAPANILSSVVVSYGLVFVPAGNKIYVLNATTGKLKYSFPSGAGTPANIVGVPAVYDKMMFFANASDVVKGVNIYNSLVQWNFTANNAITTPMEIENNYLVFGTTGGFYLLNPLNGTKFAYASVPSTVRTPIYINGEYIIAYKGTPPYLRAYSVVGGNTLVNTWTSAPMTTEFLATSPSSTGNTIAVGNGNNFYIYTLGGSVIVEYGLVSNVLGISAYKNQYYVQTLTGIDLFNGTGSSISSVTTPATKENATLSEGSSLIYANVGNALFQSYNPSLSQMLWNTSLPINYSTQGFASTALAYGKAYVVAGNTLFVYGTYNPMINDNLLQTIATMYLNNQGGYANLLLSTIYDPTKIGIFINNTYAPDYGIASFNSFAASYVEQSKGFAWMNNASQPFTISVWVKPTSGNGVILSELGQRNPNTGIHNSIIELSNGMLYERIAGQTCNGIGKIPLNAWSEIAMTYNGVYVKSFINGVQVGSSNEIRSVPGNGDSMYYPLGTPDSVNCGSGNAFSGNMIDFQIYNISLNNQQIGEIFQNGAFSSATSPQNLQLWLQLDGNADDYSGHFDSGISNQINYLYTPYTPQPLLNSYQVSKASVPLNLNASGISKNYNVSVVLWR